LRTMRKNTSLHPSLTGNTPRPCEVRPSEGLAEGQDSSVNEKTINQQHAGCFIQSILLIKKRNGKARNVTNTSFLTTSPLYYLAIVYQILCQKVNKNILYYIGFFEGI